MNRKKIVLPLSIIALVILIGGFYLKTDYEKAVPTIFYNGHILTLDEKHPTAGAMFVKDGKIVAIGELEELSIYDKEAKKRVDLKGKTVMPGFIDVHTHFALSMFLEGMHDLSGFKHTDNESVWNHFEEVVTNSSSSEWIVCKGIDPVLVKDLEIPSITYLDSVAPLNPVVIFGQSLHSYWANSKAFELVGITKQTPNPSHHSFYEKDDEGNFTGLIVEQEAFKPFVEILKKEVLTPEFLSEMSIKVMQDYTKNGNTTIVSTGLTINDSKPLILTKHLSDEHSSLLGGLLAKIGKLPTRKPMPRHFIYMRYDMAHLMPNAKEDNDFYGIIGVKHWYDGSPYIGSMYIKEPYLDNRFTSEKLAIDKGTKGKALVGQSVLKEFINKYHSKGWQIAIHTQGDTAIEEVIQVYEDLASELDFDNSRHRLEHCMLLPKNKLDAMHSLNLTPSFHINHLYYYGDALNTKILGEERAEKLFPINSAIKKNIISTLHADQPMFESQPFRLIQTAVERKTKDGQLLGDSEKISVIDAIKALTINAAWQINMEDKLGSLEKGKYADFIVVDKNPFAVPVSELHNIKCIQTYINGNLVEF